jgi:SPP1 gp7 family putative phage head morphogenesis protein
MAFGRYQLAKGKLEEAQKANAEGILMSYTVMTMDDERVCSDCAKFEGFSASVTEAVIGVNHPPFHEDCRCIATYSIEGIKKK